MKLHKVHILHIFNHACNRSLVVLLWLQYNTPCRRAILGILKKLAKREKRTRLSYERARKVFASGSMDTYMYLFQHGAKYIYDTDDDNFLKYDLSGFESALQWSSHLMLVTDNITNNPYVHFGQSTMWPRGYPLERIGLDACLLYTSPSPRDRQKSRMPSSA